MTTETTLTDAAASDELALFLDTNSLLHYPSISHTDWKAATGRTKVCLVLCLQVIHELDEKKDDARLGERARRAIKEIQKLRKGGGTVQDGVTLEVFNVALRSEEFPATLSYESKDDRIVHSVRLFQQGQPKTAVAVYTEDMGMALRCEAHAISVVEPNPAMRLESPESETQKKYRLAVTELNEVKNRVPVLDIVITDSSAGGPAKQPLSFEVPAVWAQRDIASELDAYVKTQGLAPLERKALKGTGITVLPPNHDSVDQYNKRLVKHIKDYARWLEQRALLEKVQAHLIRFKVWLTNTGKAPADDLDLTIDFPDVLVSLFPEDSDEADQLVLSEPPSPPERPSQRFVDFGSFVNPQLSMPNMERLMSQNAWVERGTSGYRVRYSTKRLKHHESEDCGTLVAVLRPDAIHPFNVQFRITEATIVQPVTGQIPFLVRKSVTST